MCQGLTTWLKPPLTKSVALATKITPTVSSERLLEAGFLLSPDCLSDAIPQSSNPFNMNIPRLWQALLLAPFYSRAAFPTLHMKPLELQQFVRLKVDHEP